MRPLHTYAAFPYAETNSISGSTVSLTISPVQKPRLGSFPVNYAVAKSERKTFVFYNICGLVGFEITEDDIASVIDLETKTLYKNVDLTSLGLEHEPEAVYFHKGDMYITFFQKGKTAIYKISLEVYE